MAARGYSARAETSRIFLMWALLVPVCALSPQMHDALRDPGSLKLPFGRISRNVRVGALPAHAAVEVSKTSPPLCSLLGPGTLMSGLHAGNKALICWCSDPHTRDTVVKVADVGFLGLLGSMSLTTAWQPRSTFSVVQPLILQAGFSHLLLEMLFNGIAIPAMCASAVDEREDPCQQGQVRSRRQEILERAARKSVAKNKTGLRKDIWLHHVLAVVSFFIVLTRGEFQEEATLLTAVEVTCGLPVAFGQAAMAKQLKGWRSLVLAVLMTSGFLLRVLLTSKLTVPRVVELFQAVFNRDGSAAQVVRTAAGGELAGSIRQPHRALLVLCSAGLTSLNVVWLGKIFGGIWKVVRRANSIRRSKSELAESAQAAARAAAAEGEAAKRS